MTKIYQTMVEYQQEEQNHIVLNGEDIPYEGYKKSIDYDAKLIVYAEFASKEDRDTFSLIQCEKYDSPIFLLRRNIIFDTYTSDDAMGPIRKDRLQTKMGAIYDLDPSALDKAAKDCGNMTFVKLFDLFKGTRMGENELLDLVGIIFTLEALILSDGMRDKRLTDLEQEQVENLAMELYLRTEKERSAGGGYFEMNDVANEVISKHLSLIEKQG